MIVIAESEKTIQQKLNAKGVKINTNKPNAIVTAAEEYKQNRKRKN